jgi:putative transcriptional regulator
MEKYQIRNNIRTLRFEHDEMTQSDLAKKVGVTRQTIIAIEKDKYSPSLDLAFRIAQAFDTPIGEVFWYEKVADTKQGNHHNHKVVG